MENGACGRARVFYGRRGQRDGSGGAAGGGELAELGWLAEPEGAEDGGLSGGGGRAPADCAGGPAEGAQVHALPVAGSACSQRRARSWACCSPWSAPGSARICKASCSQLAAPSSRYLSGGGLTMSNDGTR